MKEIAKTYITEDNQLKIKKMYACVNPECDNTEKNGFLVKTFNRKPKHSFGVTLAKT